MAIKFNKRFLITFLVVLIIAIIYNVIFFLIPLPDISKTAYYITYVCTMFSLLLFLVIFGIAFGENKNLKTRIFGVPIICVTYSFAIAQFLFDAIVMYAGTFLEFKVWICAIVEVIIIGVSLISLILRVTYRNMINNNDTKDKDKEAFIKELRIEIGTIVDENKDELISNDLHKLQELIKYTSPVSNNDVVQIENEIIDLINELRQSTSSDKSLELIKKITNLIRERKLRLQE